MSYKDTKQVEPKTNSSVKQRRMKEGMEKNVMDVF